jgi:hypothetical protein
LIGGLFCGILLLGCQPSIREKFTDTPCGMAHDAAQDIFKVGLRVDPQVSAGLYQGEQDRTGPTAVFAADEHPVLAPDGQRADGALGNVVVQPGIGMIEIIFKMRGQAQIVVQRLVKFVGPKPGRTCATYCFYAFIFKNNTCQKTLEHAF